MSCSSQLQSISKSGEMMANIERGVLSPLLLIDPEKSGATVRTYYMVHLNTGVQDDQGTWCSVRYMGVGYMGVGVVDQGCVLGELKITFLIENGNGTCFQVFQCLTLSPCC